MPLPLQSRFVVWMGKASLIALVLASSNNEVGAAEEETAPTSDLLHVWIDRAIEEPLKGQPIAPLASDDEFVRRIYLDLAGRIPSTLEAKAFLDDTAADKRETLIDALLAAPEFARRMQQAFDVMLMERRATAVVPSKEWEDYLRKSFAENRPFNLLVKEILGAGGDELRPAARFYLDRGGDLDVLTRDISRLFLGMDLQCAQCHDHPVYGDYYQSYYYGIYAFLNRSYVFTDAKTKKNTFAEKADGEVAYKSVFDATVDVKNYKPRLPEAEVVEEPTFGKDEAYVVAPTKTEGGVPKFSRRQQLAEQIAAGDHPRFSRNLANRLWYLMMGRGLVHPPDLDHGGNPPSHPELLDRLAKSIRDHDFDVKYLIRELALSDTYQRGSLMPAGMTAEQAAPERFAVANLKPLSPEQFAFSLMEAAGISDAERAKQTPKVAADKLLKDLPADSPEHAELRAKLIEQTVHDALRANVPQFVTLYGSSAGEPEQDFQATVNQALFFNNGSLMQAWLNPRSTSLLQRLSSSQNVPTEVDEVYLAILTRLPSPEERAEAIALIGNSGAESPAAQVERFKLLAWALMASSEFRFNH